MVHHLVLLSIFFLSFKLSAQDERYYRQILNGELPKLSQVVKEPPNEKFNVVGASYFVDLNSDGFEEMIIPLKKDGVDWIQIKDSSQRIIFEEKILAIGGGSFIYKIKLAHISTTARVLVLYLDEGSSSGKKFESTARIFLLTYENNDLSTMSLTQGPHHFHEKQGQREQYWRRDYSVELRDINQDGTREVIVSFDHIQRIMLYKGHGLWERF
jgi:hypothetical protein